MSEILPIREEIEAEVEKLPMVIGTRDSVMEFAGTNEQALETRWRIAQMLVKSGLVPQKRPEEVMGVMLKAFEMGIPLMQACGSMHMVNGRFGMEASMMDALAIQRCGIRKQVVEQSPERCEIILKRDGWDDLTVVYTMDDAKTAGLANKDTYKRHPAAMLYARALSRGVKQIAPDYFAGMYTIDELEPMLKGQPVERENRSTNEELDRLIHGVEPDPEVMDDDEMDAAMKDANEAKRLGLIDSDYVSDFAETITRGDWSAARTDWNHIRAMILHHEPEIDL